MENKEHLKTMLNNIVHDRNEEASVDFHNYLQAKMRELVNPTTEQETHSSSDE